MPTIAPTASMRLALTAILLAGVSLPMLPYTAAAQTAKRDGIADLLKRNGEPPLEVATPPAFDGEGKPVPPPADAREGDIHYEQARRLMAAIDAILKDTAEQRSESKKLPGKDEFILTPIWTETREDRERKINNLLDAALGIATDVPVVELQKKIEGLRKNIRELEDQIVGLKEKQLVAPKEAMLPGVLTDTVDSLKEKIADHEARIAKNNEEIAATKTQVHAALQKAGVELELEQVDMLLDSVLSGDLIRLVAAFNAAKLIDGQLAKLMQASGDNINASRKYFAMHAALFAMLVHAQNASIEKIDTTYMPKLEAILKDITAAKAKTADLMRAENRPDQKSALEANRESQKLAEEAAKGYRRYLQQQREQIAKARSRATHDLKIADNTYETVEASFQLRNLMRDSYTSFEAIQKLEAPTFDQIFKNEELRKEFENLTRKLDAPSS